MELQYRKAVRADAEAAILLRQLETYFPYYDEIGRGEKIFACPLCRYGRLCELCYLMSVRQWMLSGTRASDVLPFMRAASSSGLCLHRSDGPLRSQLGHSVVVVDWTPSTTCTRRYVLLGCRILGLCSR